jgi:hypothetical protein
MPPPPLTHCIPEFYTVYLLNLLTHGRGGGELTREKVRGAMVHKRSKIPT